MLESLRIIGVEGGGHEDKDKPPKVMAWESVKQAVGTIGKSAEGVSESLQDHEIELIQKEVKSLITANHDIVIEDFAKYLMNN